MITLEGMVITGIIFCLVIVGGVYLINKTMEYKNN